MFSVSVYDTLILPPQGGKALYIRQAVWSLTSEGGEKMPITLTFHLFGLTFTLRIKK